MAKPNNAKVLVTNQKHLIRATVWKMNYVIWISIYGDTDNSIYQVIESILELDVRKAEISYPRTL